MKTRKAGATGVSQLSSVSVRFFFSDEGLASARPCWGRIEADAQV
jgi:hypothetical protein